MSQALLFIVFRGLKTQMKVEGNSNDSHKESVTWFLSLAPPKSTPTPSFYVTWKL